MTSFDLDVLEHEYPLLRTYHERLESEKADLRSENAGLHSENAALRRALARSEGELKSTLDALMNVQARCTELLEETRSLKLGLETNSSALNGLCGLASPKPIAAGPSEHCELRWGHKGWHQKGRTTWFYGDACPRCGGKFKSVVEDGCTFESCLVKSDAYASAKVGP